jgi:hypothetical protein
VTGIDLTATGATALYTVPAGGAVVLAVVLKIATATDSTVAAVAGLEIAASSYDVARYGSTFITAAGQSWRWFLANRLRAFSPADVLSLRVQTGATATTLTATAEVIGYELS